MKPFSIRSLMKIALIVVAIPFAAVSLAEPSLKEVYQTAKSGDLKSAENMMREVLAAHPQSAQAHYVAAEILAKEGRMTEARAEFESAVRIQPDLKFAKPMAVAALQRQLDIKLPQQSAFAESWVIWALVIFGVLLVVVAVKIFRRPAPVVMAGNGMAYGANPAGYPPGAGYPQGGYPNQPMGGGGMGSGIMGGLATGAAVGAGVVAGEMLMHKVLDGDQPAHGGYVPQQGSSYQPQENSDMGGDNFGVADNGSWDNSNSFDSADSFGSGDSDSDWS